MEETHKDPKILITFRTSYKDELKRLAREKGTSVSALVREAIRSYLEGNEDSPWGQSQVY